MGYSNYFGTGYRKLTAILRKHPKHKWIPPLAMLSKLKQGNAEVAINPKPTDQIYDTMPYTEWVNNKPS